MGFHRGPQIVRNGLVLYLDAANKKSYPGTGTVWKDLSGNGNDGTLHGTPTYNTLNNGSLIFDKVDDGVLCEHTTSLDITGHITISIWFKSSNVVDIMRLVVKDSANGNFGNGINLSRYTNNRMLMTYNNGDNRIYMYSDDMGTEFFKDYHNFTYVYRGNEQKWILDGLVDVSGVNTFIENFIAGNAMGKLHVGFDGGNDDRFLGNLPILMTYNRGLTDKEILQNYNATKSRFQ